MPSIWLTKDEIAKLPASGTAFADVEKTAKGSWGTPDIHDSDYVHNIGTLAGALYAARTGDSAILAKTQKGLNDIVGTEMGGQEGGQQPALAVSRKLASYAIAADLIDHRPAAFVAWMRALLGKKLSDGDTVRGVHERRGNNWGTMAGASRIATALYLGDANELSRAITVHQGWLGDRGAYAGFDWGALDWQADKTKPVGINRKGSTLLINGAQRNVDGVQPDDQRRTGFQWPPAKGNYPWGALGAVLVTTELLRHTGHDPRLWSDGAVLRAARWLYDVGQNPPDGDDAWQPSLLGFLFPAYSWAGGTLAKGKTMAFTQWTHGGRKAGAEPVPPVTPPVTPPVDRCATERAAVSAARTKVANAQTALAAAQHDLADAEAALAACEAKG